MKRSFIRILGVRIDMVNYDSTLSAIRDCVVRHSHGNYICVCPVHPIVVSQRDKELKQTLDNSFLALPDGMAVVWATRLLGGQITNRVYGPELMLRSCEMAERKNYSIFLYGSKQETLRKLRENLLKRFLRLRVVGTYSPPFRNLTQDEKTDIIDMINSANPDILFVGLGAPKQEKWMASFCPYINVPVTLGVGAAFDFLSGNKPQAPAWMRACGLEWLFRLLCEPKRLWRRYLVYNSLFVILFLKQLMGLIFKPR